MVIKNYIIFLIIIIIGLLTSCLDSPPKYANRNNATKSKHQPANKNNSEQEKPQTLNSFFDDDEEGSLHYPGVNRRLSQSHIRREIAKLPLESIPPGTKKIQFASSLLNGGTMAEMFQHYLHFRRPVVLETVTEFRIKYPQYSQIEAERYIEICRRRYENYMNGEFDATDVNTLPPFTSYLRQYPANRFFRETLASEEEAAKLIEDELIEEMRSRNRRNY